MLPCAVAARFAGNTCPTGKPEDLGIGQMFSIRTQLETGL